MTNPRPWDPGAAHSSVPTVDDVPSTAKEVAEWIGTDRDRATLAMRVERKRSDGERQTVLDAVERARS